MNDIPLQMIFNWDQTALELVPTGQWTMNHVGDKVISIAQSSYKRQVTAVITATLTGELLAPQILYQGKTVRCHPKMPVTNNWDLWHSENHWTNQYTMQRFDENIVVPFLEEKRV